MSNFCGFCKLFKLAMLLLLVSTTGRTNNRESLSDCDDSDGSLCMCVIENGLEIQSYNLTDRVPKRDTFSSLEACGEAVGVACQKVCIEHKP